MYHTGFLFCDIVICDFRRGFTEREQQEALASGDYRRRFASDFAGKEAVYKAVKTSPDHVRGTDAEILDGKDGIPVCMLHGTLAQCAAAKGGAKMHVSLSRDGNTVVAFAVLE